MPQGENRPKKRVEGTMIFNRLRHGRTWPAFACGGPEDEKLFEKAGFKAGDEFAIITLEELDRLVGRSRAADNAEAFISGAKDIYP